MGHAPATPPRNRSRENRKRNQEPTEKTDRTEEDTEMETFLASPSLAPPLRLTSLALTPPRLLLANQNPPIACLGMLSLGPCLPTFQSGLLERKRREEVELAVAARVRSAHSESQTVSSPRARHPPVCPTVPSVSSRLSLSLTHTQQAHRQESWRAW